MSNKEGSKVKNFFGFIIYFIVKIRDDDIFALGAQLAYYMILSFFPFLIFLLNSKYYNGYYKIELAPLKMY